MLVIREPKIRATKRWVKLFDNSKCWWGCTVTSKFTLPLWKDVDTTKLETCLAICNVADTVASQPKQIFLTLLPYRQSMSPIIVIPNIKYSLRKPPLQFGQPCEPILANEIQGEAQRQLRKGFWERCYSLIKRLARRALLPILLLSVPGYHSLRT